MWVGPGFRLVSRHLTPFPHTCKEHLRMTRHGHTSRLTLPHACTGASSRSCKEAAPGACFPRSAPPCTRHRGACQLDTHSCRMHGKHVISRTNRAEAAGSTYRYSTRRVHTRGPRSGVRGMQRPNMHAGWPALGCLPAVRHAATRPPEKTNNSAANATYRHALRGPGRGMCGTIRTTPAQSPARAGDSTSNARVSKPTGIILRLES